MKQTPERESRRLWKDPDPESTKPNPGRFRRKAEEISISGVRASHTWRPEEDQENKKYNYFKQDSMKSLADILQPIQKMNIVRHILIANGNFPNNGLLPLLIYRGVFRIRAENETDTVMEILETNSWTDSWVNGIYDYHHYHSTAHEVLVTLQGSCNVQFGGPEGITLTLEKGDAAIIPAGVSHKKIDDADGFRCLGAYPEGQQYDMNYGKSEERPRADENIKKVPMPENDPLYGNDGPLIKNWLSEKDQNPSVL